mmetsp:Transcript_3024/g.4436  ORF Transcript_3024/g.4436 Transcript_3024/m.4436 type:complete len:119 (+) Transcript_3024:373-729(+)
MHVSAKYGEIKRLEILIKAGGNVNETCRARLTPLIEASKRCQIDAVSLLIKNGANINFVGHRGNTALNFAAEERLINVVRELLKNKAKLIGNDQNYTPLHMASHINHWEMILLNSAVL